MATSTVSLFDQELNDFMSDVRIVGNDLGNGNNEQLEALNEERNHRQELQLPDAGDKSGMSCSVCQVVFESVDIQREHFKLDWHRFNLKQKLLDKPVLSEDAFEETISGEVSSISGSDSDTDSDGDLTLESSQCSKPSINELFPEDADKDRAHSTGRQHPKVFFVNGDGEVLSVYRSVLYSVKNIPATPDVTLSLFTSLPNTRCWIVLMTAGGHFGGAVFNGKEVLTHKTFHRYTVRAKRGTAQGARDSQQGGKQPKSAGASLRRYNEAALLQEVQDLLEAWSKHVEQCDRIFIRTPAYNKAMFFGGKKPPFKKDDVRIRTIPFPTRRPTFNEVKRVHQQLSSVQLLGKESDEELQGLLVELTCVQSKSIENLQPVVENDKIRLWQDSQHIDSNSEVKKKVDLQERHVSNENGDENLPYTESKAKPQETSKKTKKKKTKNKKAVDMMQNGEEVSPEQHLWNRLYCAIVSANMEVISSILGVSVKSTGEPNVKTEETCLPQATNQALDVTSMSGISDLKNNELLDSDAEVTRTSERHERKLNVNTSDDSKADSNINVDTNSAGIDINEQTVSSEFTFGREDVEPTSEDTPSRKILDVINGRFGEGGDTLLHVASRSSRTEIVLTLLECGADPAVKDDKGRTPFTVASSKETRNEFRRFMASYPDRYDYAAAQIPSALTPEMENEKDKKNAERKKAQKKAQKQRIKEQKTVERKKEEEEKEAKAIQAMSDRERRAMAAEKRFAQQQASKQAGITSCCAWCSTSLAGQVPFARLTYKYCSTACVKAHRLDMETQHR